MKKFCVVFLVCKYCTMGIHYDYKSTRAEKNLRKQQKREERRNRKKRVVAKTTGYTVPLDKPITLDDLTNPNKND